MSFHNRWGKGFNRRLDRLKFGKRIKDKISLCLDKQKSPKSIHLLINDHTLEFVFPNLIAFRTFDEVIVAEEYKLFLSEEPKLILDLGANIGFSSIYFAINYPNAQIYSIEACPQNFQFLVQNTSSFSNIHPINVAISNYDGTCPFYSFGGKSTSASIDKREDLVISSKVEVNCQTYTSLLNELSLTQVDLLKFDIEGAEKFLFLDESFINFSTYLIGEVHYDLMELKRDDINSLFNDRFSFMKKCSRSRDLLYSCPIGYEISS